MNAKGMLVCLISAAALPSMGVTIQKDVSYSTTVVVEDFSGAVDPSTALQRVNFGSISGGAATYSYAAGEGPEGLITYNPLGTTFDPAVYSSMRVRMAVNRDGSATTSVEVYPTPVAGGNSVVVGGIGTGTQLRETTFDLGALNKNGNGLRIDAFNYTNDGTEDQFQIDYIMMDRGRTIGWEFDHDADFQNTTLLNLSSSGVQNGALSGTASTGDSQIWLLGNGATGPDIDGDIYKYVEIRMKGDVGDRVDLFWNTAAKSSLTPKVDVDASADGAWHTYLLDFSDEANWTGNLTAFRLDPTASTSSTFEVDYVRFMETIPEPATLGMVVAMGAGMFFIRRRLMI